MNNKTTLPTTVSLKSLLLLFILLNSIIVNAQTAQQLLKWNANNTIGFGPSPWNPTNILTGVSTSGLQRGNLISTTSSAAQDCWGGSGGWVVTQAPTTTDKNSFYFNVTSSAGYTISLSSIETRTQRSQSGPTKYKLEYSIDGITYISLGERNTGTGGTNNTHSLTTLNDLQNITVNQTINFRITPQGSTGNYYLNGGNALVVKGFIISTPPPCETPIPVATAQTFAVRLL